MFKKIGFKLNGCQMVVTEKFCLYNAFSLDIFMHWESSKWTWRYKTLILCEIYLIVDSAQLYIGHVVTLVVRLLFGKRLDVGDEPYKSKKKKQKKKRE